MSLKITPKGLLALLGMPLRIASPASPLAALKCLEIRDGLVTATDLSTSVQVETVDYGIFEGIKGCVDAKLLSLALSTLPQTKELSVTLQGDRLLLQVAGGRRTVPLVNGIEFPAPVWGVPTQRCPDPSSLRRAIEFVRHAADPSGRLRPMFNGVSAAGGSLFATDGMRAARQAGAAQAAGIDDETILPLDALDFIVVLADMAIEGDELKCGMVQYAQGGQARAYVMACGRVQLQFQLVAASPPALERLIPPAHAPMTIQVGRLELAAECRGMQRIGSGLKKPPPVLFRAESSTSLSAELVNGASEAGATNRFDCVIDNWSDWQLGLPPGQVADALESLSGETVTMSRVDRDHAPVLITGRDADQVCMVMPVRI